MNKFLRCDNFKEANRKATEIFVEYRDFTNSNYPYYYVTTNENIVQTDDKTIEIIKLFNPEN